MVFMGEVDKATNSKGLGFRREELENKRHLFQEFFANPEAELRVEFISHLRPPPPAAVLDSGTVTLSRHTSIETKDGIKMIVGFVPLMDLYRISDRLQRRFLSRNIRFGLSPDNPPNRKIRQALGDAVIRHTVATDIFPFNHNGVALAAKQVVLNDGKATLTVPRLLNGAQTITSIKVFIEENQKHLNNSENQQKLEEIHVLAKIIESDPTSDFVTNVTICNNRQNPVEPWDLRANDRIQCDLEDKLREEARVFYSRQENAFENMSEDELESMGVDGSKDIRIRPLAQTFLAVQGEIGRMSKLPDVFEIQKQYEETFRQSYLDADARKIVLAYKVYLAIKSPMEHLDELVAQKWSTPLRRARNLVWALMIQAVLNDPQLKQNLDSYAESLSVSWEFRDYLRKVAAGKVRKIMSYIFNHRDFADRLQREKYDFLRTKETFQRCMDYAFREFDWTKKSL